MNKEILFEKIKFIEDNLKYLKIDLKDFNSKKKIEFNEKRRIINSIKRENEEIVETLIKINNILLKKIGIYPNSYRLSFLELKKLSILNEEKLIELSKTAIFRNELAHDYINLSEKRLITNSNNIIKLYPNFLKIIKKYIIENID